MEKINNICWIVVLALASFILGYTKGASDTEKELDIIDTTYNIITLDSIKYNSNFGKKVNIRSLTVPISYPHASYIFRQCPQES